MKVLFLSAAVLLFAASGASANTLNAYQVGHVRLACTAANGVRIESKDVSSNIVETRWGSYQRFFHFNLNPGFFQWTWIRLGGSTPGGDYDIFLLGNAPAGREVVLTGAIGRVVTTPGLSGLRFPLGFTPTAAISCRVYWENTLPQLR